MDASPVQIQEAIEQWYRDASKEFYVGPDVEAMRVLKERERALLDDDPSNDPAALPPRNVMAVVVNFGGTDTVTRPYPDSNNPGGSCVPHRVHLGTAGAG